MKSGYLLRKYRVEVRAEVDGQASCVVQSCQFLQATKSPSQLEVILNEKQHA
jgi:hypothetical protein